MILQAESLLRAEGVEVSFTDEAISSIAENAFAFNQSLENIGARRLHTILETLLEEISFEAPEKKGEKYVVDKTRVVETLKSMNEDRNIAKYIL